MSFYELSQVENSFGKQSTKPYGRKIWDLWELQSKPTRETHFFILRCSRLIKVY